MTEVCPQLALDTCNRELRSCLVIDELAKVLLAHDREPASKVVLGVRACVGRVLDDVDLVSSSLHILKSLEDHAQYASERVGDFCLAFAIRFNKHEDFRSLLGPVQLSQVVEHFLPCLEICGIDRGADTGEHRGDVETEVRIVLEGRLEEVVTLSKVEACAILVELFNQFLVHTWASVRSIEAVLNRVATIR